MLLLAIEIIFNPCITSGHFVQDNETNVSISGKHYVTANKTIQNNDIITIDLSPQNNNVWGDYARTIIIENEFIIFL